MTSLTVLIDRLPDGGLRFTSPALPGFGCIGRGPHGIARALERCWNELDIRLYAQRKGEPYDLVVHDVAGDAPERINMRQAAAIRRALPPIPDPPATQSLRELERARQWGRLPSGDWRSPQGRRFRPSSLHVRRVLQILALHGEAPRLITA